MIYKHILEIKYRVFFSIIAWSFLIFNCYFFKETLLYILITFSLNYSYNGLSYFLITNITEIFMVYLQLSYFIANQITFIFICCQVFAFISTGLYRFEYIYLQNIIITILICWLSFVWVVNFIIFPTSWNFFLQFQNFMLVQNLTFYFEAKISEYWTFYLAIYYLCYIFYQLIVFFWVFLNLFKTNFLIIKKLRKNLHFVFFVLATFVTPPDVAHQIITSICMIILHELLLIYILLKIEFIYFRSVIS